MTISMFAGVCFCAEYRVCIVVLTAFSDEAYWQRAAAAGACGVYAQAHYHRDVDAPSVQSPVTVSIEILNEQTRMTKKSLSRGEMPTKGSKHKQTEQQLRRSLDLLRAVTEGTTDAIYAKDLEGRYLMINTPGTRRVRKTQEQILGRDDTQIFSPETAADIRESDRLVMELGETIVQERVRVTGGVARTYQSTRRPLRAEDGKIIGVVGISRDITEQSQAERTLQHIMEGSHCLLWQAEVKENGEGLLQWKVQFASEQAAHRFFPLNVTANESYGDAWHRSRPLEDRERTDRYGAQEVRAGRSYQQEF